MNRKRTFFRVLPTYCSLVKPHCVEELLAARGVTVSHEAVRLWCLKFGQTFAKNLRYRRGRPGDTWHLDELFMRIRGQRHYL